jgi:hypothetical protein
MGKNTNILIGAGALAVVYYLYNASKSSASVSPNGATLPPISTIPNKLVDTTPVRIVPEPPYPVKVPPQPDYTPLPIRTPPPPDRPDYEKQFLEKREYDRIESEKAAELAVLAEIKAYEEENALQQAKNIANQKAYEASEEFLRQKAMNTFMYPTCPDGFEFYQNNCMPTYLIVEEKAKKGEGLVLRDFKSNTTTLVQTCPSEYVKQGINCIPRYSLSPQALQVLAMEESGMVQTSDGQWYTNAASAAAAQAIIDAQATQYGGRGYSDRQNSINEAICSVNRDGYINNPNSSTNGMSLSQYIGQFKVTANELGIARASCPNSVYSSNLIAGGRTDDNALGYKTIYKQEHCDKGYVYFPNYGCDKDQGSDEENIKFDIIIQQKLKNRPRQF